MAKEPQQASPMSKMDRTLLPSTIWPFVSVFVLQVSKNDDEEHCF